MTAWVSVAELALKSALPPYLAVIVCIPEVSADVGKVATPPANVTVPKIALPFLNVTLPVGVPDEEETVAVNVTACPNIAGFELELTMVLLGVDPGPATAKPCMGEVDAAAL